VTSETLKHFKFTVTAGLLAFMETHRIRSNPRGRQRFRVGEVLRAANDAHLHAYSMHLAGAHLLSLGAFSYSVSPLSTRVKMGRYCSIGPNVRLMGLRHNIESVTSAEILFRGRRGLFVDTFEEFAPGAWKFAENPSPGDTIIGNDVWIGQDALLKQGITIGTGAVVGAAAVVLRDVAPYEIVGGVPAKRIRWRFDERIIAGLLESEWWRYAIPQHPDLPWTDPAAFLPALAEKKAAGRMAPFESDLGPLREILKKTS